MRNIIKNKTIAAESYMPSGEKQKGFSSMQLYLEQQKGKEDNKNGQNQKNAVSNQQTQDPHQRVAPTQKHLTYSKQKEVHHAARCHLHHLQFSTTFATHFPSSSSGFFSTQAIFGLGYRLSRAGGCGEGLQSQVQRCP